jgi:hypothetical protein
VFIADEKNLLTSYDVGDEVLALGKFTTELPGKIDRRINLAPQLALRFPNCRDHRREREVVTDNQYIYITHGCVGSRCDRSEDEGQANEIRHGRQRLSELLGHAEGLANGAAKLREYGTLAIRLEVNLTALDASGENPAARKPLQISLNSPRSETYCLDHAPLIESFVRVPEQQRKYPLPRLSEEDLSKRGSCEWYTHIEYDNTHLGYISQCFDRANQE